MQCPFHAVRIGGLLKSFLHLLQQHIPRGLRYGACGGAVSNDFDGVVRQQQVNQHTVVVLCIPGAQLAKQSDSPLSGRGVAPDVAVRQPAFHAQTDLAGMLEFALGDGVF